MIFLILVITTAAIILNGDTVRAAVISGTDECLNTLIPSIFPMLIISFLFSSLTLSERIKQRAEKVTEKLFGLTGSAVVIFLLALTQGYPVAAKNAVQGLERKRISVHDAKIITLFFTSPGISFTVVTAGNTFFRSSRTGFSLFFACVIPEILLCFMYNLLSANKQSYSVQTDFLPSVPQNIFTEAVAKASASMLNICAWVLCFSVLSSLLMEYINIPFLRTAFLMTAEVSSALTYCMKTGNIPLAAFCLSFGGICVSMQILPEIKKAGIRPAEYYFVRLLCAALSFFIEKLFLFLLPGAQTVSAGFESVRMYSNSITGSVSLIILCIVFLFSVSPVYIRKKKYFH